MFKLDTKQRERIYIPLDKIKENLWTNDPDAVAMTTVKEIDNILDFHATESLMADIVSEIMSDKSIVPAFSSWNTYKKELWLIRSAYLSGALFAFSASLSEVNDTIKELEENTSEAEQRQRADADN